MSCAQDRFFPYPLYFLNKRETIETRREIYIHKTSAISELAKVIYSKEVKLYLE
jgi:hypothetical protein